MFLNNLRKFRLVTFDVTDTLLRFSSPPAIQYAKTAAEFGYHNIDQRKLEENFRSQFKYMAKAFPNFGKTTVGMTWEDWWRKLVIEIFIKADSNIPSKDLYMIANRLIEQYATSECWTKTEGSFETITKIKNSGLTVGVISNFDPRLHTLLKNTNLPSFDFVLTSYELGVLKPDAKIFEEALKYCNTTKTQSVHIGNTLKLDYLGAKNAGWYGVHIANKSTDWRTIPSVSENHVFDNLQIFLEKLENHTILW